jgi:hypothetical protein
VLDMEVHPELDITELKAIGMIRVTRGIFMILLLVRLTEKVCLSIPFFRNVSTVIVRRIAQNIPVATKM